MEIVSTNALISINATFFAQLIAFLLFMFALNKVMVRPLRKIAENRSDYLNRIQNEIAQSKEQLGKISAELERKKIRTIDESFIINNKKETEAKNKAMNIYNKTRREILTLQKKSDQEIKQEIASLRIELHKNIDSISTAVMEKILDRRL